MIGVSDNPMLPVLNVTYQQRYLIKTGQPQSLLTLGTSPHSFSL